MINNIQLAEVTKTTIQKQTNKEKAQIQENQPSQNTQVQTTESGQTNPIQSSQNQNIQGETISSLSGQAQVIQAKQEAQEQIQSASTDAKASSPNQSETNLDKINAKLEKAKKQNGLIEKAADFIKGKTGIGLSSKKIQDKINKGESEEVILKDITNYRRQQENTAHAFVDLITCIPLLFSFAKSKEFGLIEMYRGKISGQFNLFKGSEKLMSSLFPAISLGMFGALAKRILMSLNRIGTDQYKVKKNNDQDSDDYKILKNATKKEKRNADFRNSMSGLINGISTPLMALGGGILGLPLYAILNSLNRYFIATKEDSGEKSINSYINSLKNSPVTNGVPAAIIIAGLMKKGIYVSSLEKNIEKAFNKINASGLKSFNDGLTTYEKLANVLKNNSSIDELIEEYQFTGETNQKIAEKIYNRLYDENIFLLKILQIQEDENKILALFKGQEYTRRGEILKALSDMLKADGPRTYKTKEAVQEAIDNAFGKGKYTLAKESPLGVGTVAETYLVKDESGKELVAKILKKDISSSKFDQSAEKCQEIIKKADLPDNDKKVLLHALDDIMQGVKKEIDLNHEMEAAKKLQQSTKLAQVAQGVEVSGNGKVYIMQKADGECLQRVTEYFKRRTSLESDVNRYRGLVNQQVMGKTNGQDYKKDLELAQKRLEAFDKVHARMKGFEQLTDEDSRALLSLYQDVLVEQFSKVDPKGKTIHADIHPGNIMIDYDALKKYAAGDKSYRSKVFTLIDTGNTIEQTPELAMKFLNLSRYIENADAEKIAEFVLEGATLPSGKIYSKSAKQGENIASKEEMDKYFNLVKEKLVGKDGKSGIFFDSETALGQLTNQSLLDGFTDKILQDLDIVPSSTQGNLIKAQTSAKNSLKQFRKNNAKTIFKNFSNGSTGNGVLGIIRAFRETKDFLAKQKRQEEANLRRLSPAERRKIKGGANVPKKNSIEYLTYILKQSKKISEEQEAKIDLIEGLFDL